MVYLFYCAILTFAPAIHGLIGYDCGGQALNITTLSLLDIENCETEDVEPNTEETQVQFLQLSEYDHAEVRQCKVEVDRTIYHCGMHSHISVVHNGRKEYIVAMSAATCRKLQDSGSINLGGNAYVVGMKMNMTDTRSLTLAGSISVDGRCSGTQYSDPYGTWDNVVVQASVRITLRQFTASITRSTSEIILPSGLRCPVFDGECLDSDGGETFWSPIPTDSCRFDHYDILYEGIANKLTPKQNQTLPTVYTVTSHDMTFALTQTSDMNLCGYRLLRTEHPKLFIFEVQRGRTFRIRSKISVDNLDIFSYVNSKFVYVEKHIRTQLTQLYRNVMEQKCQLEKQVLKNALSLSTIAPDEMAYSMTKSPGYTAVTSGEVIHLIKCIPVECRLRKTDQCYNELPVTHRNTSFFLTPKSRILVKIGTPRDCNELLPAMYRIHGTWFRLAPRPMEAVTPQTIQPLTRPTWKYVSPMSLATSGIYSDQDLNRLRNHIMFPVEKPSMLHTLARGAMGHEIPPGTVALDNLLDENSLTRIAENAGARIWKGFMNFGSASAGVLAIIIIIRLAKLIIDTVIHGYALHSVYGWSLHLFGAIWSSVTQCLLYRGKRTTAESRDQPPTRETTREDNQDRPLPPFIIENSSVTPEMQYAPCAPDQVAVHYKRQEREDSATAC